VTAAVVVRPGQGTSDADLVAHCAAHLANYKKPRFVIFVDEMPRGATGKIDKAQLLRLFMANIATNHADAS
jgi:acyl-CoA synthetase (AMP-forming)/AMP-acid ligase II